ncbi:MAG: threonine/serine exporter family protein [Bacteroidales bacterium]|nr:threonine/serine exporter family protein [Bacteroidales bacterium]MBO5847048.1 threonine/serine exporter family protein [Bacteroidales bacterium]MBO5916151.1 threonine/serine exporter family protein [Bacteroidales bacterium]MBO7182932.1 threonine/serine exporter family protein [Bacteroidales bacterium]MBO7325085.1 threonine/serine exporter family protein [Bacteroidales bacterium]
MITWNEMLIQVLAGFIGTYAFSLTYSVSARHYFFAGLTGAIGWAAYLFFLKIIGYSVVTSTFFSTLFIATSARCFAVWRRCPSMIFLIPGLFPIVPGAGIYWSFYYLFVNNLDKSLDFGLLAIKSALAIVLGIVLIHEIPHKTFKIFKVFHRFSKEKID